MVPLRRLAGLLACALVLFGTTGIVVLDGAAHASGAHASQHEGDGSPDGPQDGECALCTAASMAAAAATGVAGAMQAAPVATPSSAGTEELPGRAAAYLAQPVRGPPSA
jgi:hypothetical protein